MEIHEMSASQQRALVIRDQLRYSDPQHLNSFLEGVTDHEPPNYQMVRGKILPELTFVTLRDTATRLDLGNVIFPKENDAIHQVYLTVKQGEFEMETAEMIPIDDTNLYSHPMYDLIARNILPLFQKKFIAINERKNKINEARRNTYNMQHQPTSQFHQGKSLQRLSADVCGNNRHKDSRGTATLKRKNGDPVIQHSANKRKRIGVDAIPEGFKSSIFGLVSKPLQINLFNELAGAMFPNYDNLIMAAWNVVSIYNQLGGDWPDMHTAIGELNSVLKEIHTAYGKGTPIAGHKGQNSQGILSINQNGNDGKDFENHASKTQGTRILPTSSKAGTELIVKRAENGATKAHSQRSSSNNIPKIKKESEDIELSQVKEIAHPRAAHGANEPARAEARSKPNQSPNMAHFDPRRTSPSQHKHSFSEPPRSHHSQKGTPVSGRNESHKSRLKMQAPSQSEMGKLRDRVDAPSLQSKYPGIDPKAVIDEINKYEAEKAAREAAQRYPGAPYPALKNWNPSIPTSRESNSPIAMDNARGKDLGRPNSPKVIIPRPDFSNEGIHVLYDDVIESPRIYPSGFAFGHSLLGSPKRTSSSSGGVPMAKMVHNKDDTDAAHEK